MEQLEDRSMLAVFFVNNLFDLDENDEPVVGSLRQAVQLANDNDERDTIFFRHFLVENGPASIGLAGGDGGGALALTNTDGIDIVGPGAGLLTIFGPNNDRIFLVDDGSEDEVSFVTISGLRLSGGGPDGDNEDGKGGAILNRESLQLVGMDIDGNFAEQGGGGIFNDTGFVSLDGSLVRNNQSLQGGGGIQNGTPEQDDNLPRTDIVNSTITGNRAIGIPDDEDPTGYGGGVFNAAGTVYIEQSTIYDNFAADHGGGVAELGFDPEFEEDDSEPPVSMPTVFSGTTYTTIRSSIITGNNLPMDTPEDVAGVGMTDDEEMPMPFSPQIHSEGYNLFGVLFNVISLNEDIDPPGTGPNDVVGVDPASLFIEDIMTGDAILGDFGGVLPVFMPDINKNSIAIDAGDPEIITGFTDQRGYQFTRVFGAGMDIGAAELQVANFLVDNIVDESDGRFEPYFDLINGFIVQRPAFSLRDALDQAGLNQASGLPGISTISFDSILTNNDANPDPVANTAARTILLTLGQINVGIPVSIQGPSFDIEIDATGNDPTPANNNGDGSRVFQVSSMAAISNLTIRGGDVQERGGGIASNGDLTLTNVTLLDNNTTGVGGAIAVVGGSLNLSSTTINANRASNSGGGVHIASGSVTIENSTISGNTGQLHGGGIANANGDLTIRYSTITLNTAGSSLGGGVASFRNGTATTEIRSSIIAGNTANDVQHVQTGSNNITSLGYNLVGNGNAVTAGVFNATGDLKNTNPLLAPLLNLGGRTAVHRLLPGSPAIDAGDPNDTGLGNVPDYDQRGFPFTRVVDGNNDADARIDIGAFEVPSGILFVGDGSPAEGSYPTFQGALADANLSPLPEIIVFLPTWAGESFPGTLQITDSLDIIADPILSITFFGAPDFTLLVDDNNNSSLSDVEISGIRFENNARITSNENLTLDGMQFATNVPTFNNPVGRAITHQFGDLKINNSSFIGNSAAGNGGAISVLDGNLELKDTQMSGNSTTTTGGKGGAIYIRNGNLTAEYLYLTGNLSASGTGDGGALYGRNGTMMLTNAIISGNRTSGSNAEGGGVSLRDVNATFVDSIIAFNESTGLSAKGGGIFVSGGTLMLDGGELNHNTTNGGSASGGAIASMGADVTIKGINVSDNSTAGIDAHGGAFFNGPRDIGEGVLEHGSLTIVDSAVYGNRTTGTRADGGAIYTSTNLTTDRTSILNSTISGNITQDKGGGIYNANGLTVITHSTITNNSVPYYGFGAGVASFGNNATTTARTEVGHSIIAGNKVSVNLPGNTSTDVDRVGGNFQDSFFSLGYNLIGLGLTGAFTLPGTTDLFGIGDPKLEALGNNGGVTLTHALQEDSLAVNRGNPAAVAGSNGVPLTDQRGEARIQNGRLDIGAFESDFGGGAPGDFNGDGVVNGRDFLAWQRNPSIGDLADWQAAYGTSESLVATMVTTDEVGETSLTALAVEEEPQAASPTESRSVVLGWIFPTSSPAAATPQAADESSIDEFYTAAFEAQLQPVDLGSDALDFGDFATSRSAENESEELAAEDAVFELIGAGEL